MQACGHWGRSCKNYRVLTGSGTATFCVEISEIILCILNCLCLNRVIRDNLSRTYILSLNNVVVLQPIHARNKQMSIDVLVGTVLFRAVGTYSLWFKECDSIILTLGSLVYFFMFLNLQTSTVERHASRRISPSRGIHVHNAASEWLRTHVLCARATLGARAPGVPAPRQEAAAHVAAGRRRAASAAARVSRRAGRLARARARRARRPAQRKRLLHCHRGRHAATVQR